MTGKVKNTGLIEVPMGTTLRHIVEVMGGGVPDGAVKAVQTGGPSGGCIPAEHLDTPVDYESLGKLGSIMGSGGMIVMDQTTNMVEVARFFMEFCMDESCGKCIPCRAGTVQMHQLLTKISEKRATRTDYDRLVQLCNMVRETSLCGLGQTAPNPVLSTMRYFANEYESAFARETRKERPGRPRAPDGMNPGCRTPPVVAWFPDHATGPDRRSPPLLWHGLPTVPPDPTEGLRFAPCATMQRVKRMETFGRAKWHGRETVPQQRPTAFARSARVVIPSIIFFSHSRFERRDIALAKKKENHSFPPCLAALAE